MSAAGRLDTETLHDWARLERLVFAPLRAAVVPTAEWKPDQPTVPGTALPQFMAMTRSGIAEQLAAWDPSAPVPVAGGPSALATKLWSAAGRLLRGAACPPSWTSATGLRTEDFETIRTPVAQMLAQAANIERFVARCEASRLPPEPRHAKAVLDDLARGGAPGFRLGLVILLRRCARQDGLAALALSTARGDDAIEEAAYSAATYVLDTAVSRNQEAARAASGNAGAVVPGQPLALAAEIADAARLVRCIEPMAALRPMSKLNREVGRKRVILQAVCLDRFEEHVALLLLRPLAVGQAGTPDGLAALCGVAAELSKACDALRLLGDRHGTERAIQNTARRAGAALGRTDPQGAVVSALVARLQGAA